MLCFREYFYLVEKMQNNFSETSLKPIATSCLQKEVQLQFMQDFT